MHLAIYSKISHQRKCFKISSFFMLKLITLFDRTILLNRKLLLSKYYILKQADKAVFYSNLLAKTSIRAKFYDIFQIFHVFE